MNNFKVTVPFQTLFYGSFDLSKIPNGMMRHCREVPSSAKFANVVFFTGVCLSTGTGWRERVCIQGWGAASRGGGSASGGVGQTTIPPSDTTRYGQRMGGTHPTGMYSCCEKKLIIIIIIIIYFSPLDCTMFH